MKLKFSIAERKGERRKRKKNPTEIREYEEFCVQFNFLIYITVTQKKRNQVFRTNRFSALIQTPFNILFNPSTVELNLTVKLANVKLLVIHILHLWNWISECESSDEKIVKFFVWKFSWDCDSHSYSPIFQVSIIACSLE